MPQQASRIAWCCVLLDPCSLDTPPREFRVRANAGVARGEIVPAAPPAVEDLRRALSVRRSSAWAAQLKAAQHRPRRSSSPLAAANSHASPAKTRRQNPRPVKSVSPKLTRSVSPRKPRFTPIGMGTSSLTNGWGTIWIVTIAI